MTGAATVFARQYFHGTRADLAPGDLIVVGHPSNFREEGALSWVYFTGTLDAAIWGAELATGEAAERIYIVEPTDPHENDPNLTDRRFPGNPTEACWSRAPLRVVHEVVRWQGHPPEAVQAMRAAALRLADGGAAIID